MDPGAPPVLDRRRRRRVTDERILQAAVSEFGRRGFAGASMQAIADAAKTTKATIYANLGDKDALYEATVVSEVGALRETLLGAYASVSEQPVPEQLRAGIAAIFSFARARPDGFRLLLGDAADRSPEDQLLREVQEEIVAAIEAMVSPRLDRAGLPSEKGARLIAAMLVGMFRAAATTAMLDAEMEADAAVAVAESLATAALRGFDSSLLAEL